MTSQPIADVVPRSYECEPDIFPSPTTFIRDPNSTMQTLRAEFFGGPLASVGEFSFVEHHPEPKEGLYIPVRPFTAYFSRWEIPVIGVGHDKHDHDLLHTRSYREMFAVPAFATLVHTGATNAVRQKTDDLCKKFTDGLDEFGDAMNELMMSNLRGGRALRDACGPLRTLIEVAEPDTALHDELFASLWKALQFDRHQAQIQRHDTQVRISQLSLTSLILAGESHLG